jgi:predicted MPP superfamily phosphohydrolase
MESADADHVRNSRLTRRAFLRNAALLGTGAVATSGLFCAYDIEPDDLHVTRATIGVPGTPGPNGPLKIGLLSDFHCDSQHSVARTVRAADMLMSLKPDLVVLTGDYISHVPSVWANPAANALSSLTASPHGAYAVLGNHDWASGDVDAVAMELSQVGIRVLRNESVLVPGTEHTWLVGLEDMLFGIADIDQALLGVPQKAIRILLVHEPDYADEAPAGFALQLSGHSHGGQVRVPGLRPLYTPLYGRKYPEGLQAAPNHRVFTTRGVGMTAPRFRLFCPPEVALITLCPA